MTRIDVFVLAGCNRCNEGLDALQRVAESFGSDQVVWKERNLLEEIDYAVDLGILSAPAIAIDGKLIFSSLPTPQRLQAEIARTLES